MRAFLTTASIVAGKDIMWTTNRTGHTSLAMVRNYERGARRWRELNEGAPVAVNVAIPEFAAAETTLQQERSALVLPYGPPSLLADSKPNRVRRGAGCGLSNG